MLLKSIVRNLEASLARACEVHAKEVHDYFMKAHLSELQQAGCRMS